VDWGQTVKPDLIGDCIVCGRFTIIDYVDLVGHPIDQVLVIPQQWMARTKPLLDQPIFSPQGDLVPDSPNIPNLELTYVGTQVAGPAELGVLVTSPQ